MGPGKDKKSPEEQAEIEKLRREVETLKKVISDLAIDNSILKEANEILKKKQTTPAWFRSPKK
jgi:regulator of replication initiation timing